MRRPRLSLRPLPAHLGARYRQLGERERAQLAAALDAHYFADCDPGYLAGEIGRRDRDDHLFRRLDVARRQVVPWLDAAQRLDGARLLEIGCGTGSATVALAEQGARVTGVDLCERSLRAARLRCELHGVEAGFVLGNAALVLDKLDGERFDWILFYASLEHMTFPERKQALRRAWELLAPGSLLGVVETPNRLWLHDSHTSLLPYFHWLPDDVAFEYSRRSPRAGFRECYRVPDADAQLHFLRRGRGVSYHEFELALGPATQLDVVSCLRGFQRARHRLPAWARWRTRHALESRYEALLAETSPGLHPGFLQPYLDLVIRKRAG
jgi:S-adenosylmethionine-dependent methyltransferase